MRRILIPGIAFAAGAAIMAGIYLGFLSWLEGWDYAAFQFWRDRSYVVPVILAFGVQSALYSILRFGLYAPAVRPTALPAQRRAPESGRKSHGPHHAQQPAV